MDKSDFGPAWLKLPGLVRTGLLLFLMNAVAQRISAQFPVPAAPKQQPVTPCLLKIYVEEGKVTAEIRECPFQDVLRELADRTGIIFEVRAHENPGISIELKGVPVREAIERIASGNNTVFLYAEEAGGERISMVRIFPRTQLSQPGILYLGTGKITKYGDVFITPEQALKILSESSDVRERENAVAILAAAGPNEAAIKVLTKAVSDPAPEVRIAAIESLAAMEARSALPKILSCFKDNHPGVRQVAATAVGMLGDKENLKQLKPLANDKDASVAAAAEWAMRKLSGETRK